MKRRGLCMALGLLAVPAPAEGGLREARRVGLAFGTIFSIRALHAEPGILAGALDAAVAELRRLQSVLSLFDPASQVSRLNRDGVLQAPDPALLAVLAEARRIWAASGGERRRVRAGHPAALAPLGGGERAGRPATGNHPAGGAPTG